MTGVGVVANNGMMAPVQMSQSQSPQSTQTQSTQTTSDTTKVDNSTQTDNKPGTKIVSNSAPGNGIMVKSVQMLSDGTTMYIMNEISSTDNNSSGGGAGLAAQAMQAYQMAMALQMLDSNSSSASGGLLNSLLMSQNQGGGSTAINLQIEVSSISGIDISSAPVGQASDSASIGVNTDNMQSGAVAAGTGVATETSDASGAGAAGGSGGAGLGGAAGA